MPVRRSSSRPSTARPRTQAPAAPAPRARVFAVALLVSGLIVGGLLAGCGGSAVKPAAWAKSVCTALTPWRTQVAGLTQQAQREIDQTRTPVQTKQSLMTLLSGAERASDLARRRILAAGVPDVDGGKKAADTFVTALTRARDAYGHTRTTIAGLDPSEAKPFYDAVERAFSQLGTEYSGSVLNISKVGPAPLHKAFDEVPECR